MDTLQVHTSLGERVPTGGFIFITLSWRMLWGEGSCRFKLSFIKLNGYKNNLDKEGLVGHAP